MSSYSLASLGLVDSPQEAVFDNLTQLATKLLGVPVSLLSIVEVEKNRQYFKSMQGVPASLSELRQTPLSHSFCQHVVRNNDMLVVTDSRADPLVSDNPAVRDFGVAAYLGSPVYSTDDSPIGSFCAIDSQPRQWSEDDRQNLKGLAACVTDAIRMGALIRDNEALYASQRDFAFAISHDMKAPLLTLKMLLSELVESNGERIDEGGHKLLALSHGTLERASTLTDEILEYTRASSLKFDSERVSLDDLLNDVAADLKGTIDQCGATLDLTESGIVTGSRMQLSVLFRNLISNALKFQRGEVAPVVKVSLRSENGRAVIRVADNGIGIPPEDHERLFNLFERLNTQDEFPGTGLGMALVQRIVANHGASISVESSEGQGTTFVIVLPDDVHG